MNIVIAQSGGPTCAINATLAGVYLEACKHPEIEQIYGSRNGIEGILHDRLVDLRSLLPDAEQVDLLCRTPSTVLGSCRVKLPLAEENTAPYETIHNSLKTHSIDAFFYIGGNDSMDTVAKLSAYLASVNSPIRVIGIPKTIDNDLMYTDHTPGFGSAVKYVTTTLAEIAQDSAVYNLPSVTIVEIMGRDAGWLTASTCLLHHNGLEAPHLIYLPEIPFSTERFLIDVRRMQSVHKSVIVAVSEGVRLSEGGYAADDFQSGENDAFGHKYLAGVGKYLENMTRKHLGCKVRSIELNVMQRCAAHLASEADIAESLQVGAGALCTMLEGKSGCMMTLQRTGDTPYRIEISTVEAQRVANRIRLFPQEWITPDGNGVCQEAIPYFLPLIQGERYPIIRNGMPVHFIL
ncbi:6-phosphofructokinase [Ruminococcus sp.]|uniref:6-phosphofructokinase n=1 Tax=Ruminococcus sp. TaxID=41978 RepID=UPI0025D8028C|nr:6-phosphofructokinase [Ruminococcus sp.]MCI5815720.1 6-phosphofructokinase [Ruminococcus sp.]